MQWVRRTAACPMVDHDPAANLHGKSALVIIVPHLVKIQPLGDGAAVYPKAGKEHRVAQHLHQFKAFFSCVNGHSVLLLSFPHRFPGWTETASRRPARSRRPGAWSHGSRRCGWRCRCIAFLSAGRSVLRWHSPYRPGRDSGSCRRGVRRRSAGRPAGSTYHVESSISEYRQSRMLPLLISA